MAIDMGTERMTLSAMKRNRRMAVLAEAAQEAVS